MFLQEGESTFDHLISFEGALGGFKENYGSYLLDVSLLYPCCILVVSLSVSQVLSVTSVLVMR